MNKLVEDVANGEMERMFLPMAAVGVVMIGLLLLRAEMLGEDDLLRINLDNDDMVIII